MNRCVFLFFIIILKLKIYEPLWFYIFIIILKYYKLRTVVFL